MCFGMDCNFKNGLKCGTVLEMSSIAFGEPVMSKIRVYEWFHEDHEDNMMNIPDTLVLQEPMTTLNHN